MIKLNPTNANKSKASTGKTITGLEQGFLISALWTF